MKKNVLKEKIARLPQTSGVYTFKDASQEPIYIGKAARLKARVRSYFQRDGVWQNRSKQSFIDEIADIEVRPTQSEIEALVLESQLIKTARPRYNILMRDDKQYFYVGFTKETFPKIFLTHQKKALSARRQAQTYIGPFTDGKALKTTLRLLRRVFPYCTCRKPHKQLCLNCHIGIDPGYCCVKNAKLKTQNSKPQIKNQKEYKEYKNNIEHIRNILKGQGGGVLKEIKREMKEAAQKQNFEEAAKLRNQWEGAQNVLSHKSVLEGEEKKEILKESAIPARMKRVEGYDISNIQGRYAVGSMVVFKKNSKGGFAPEKSDYRRFKIKLIKGANDPAMIKEVLTRRLRHREWPLPDLIVIDGGKAQRNAALEAIAKAELSITVFALAKEEEELYTGKEIIPLSSLPKTDELLFLHIRNEAHRFAISYYRKLHAKSLRAKSK